MNDKNVLTTGEVAKYCDVNFRTVIRWIEKGYLKAYKLPGRGDNRIPKESLVAFLVENSMPVPDELRTENNRVLVVEDLPEMAKAIARTLKRAKFEVEIAANGFEAGEMIRRFKPFAITLDLQMPGLSGFDVIRYMKSQADLRKIKILVVSAQSEDQIDKSIKLGANGFLTKPFENAELVSSINELKTSC